MPSVTFVSDSDDQIVVGVDTHSDTHVAVALSSRGAVLASTCVQTTSCGLRELREWACALGEVAAWGVEGTGCYGAGLARVLLAAGEQVIEINRPDRRTRRVRGGKTDLIDAEAAARSVLSNYATTTPKAGNGVVEMLRVIRAARSSAVKGRTAAVNQLKSLLVTANPELRDALTSSSTPTLIARCAALQPSVLNTPDAAVRYTLRHLADRYQQLTRELREHTAQLTRLLETAAPLLLAEHGVGPDTAAALMITAGDNPERLHSETAFAALCGTNPIPASSGKTDRHRLNRNGDRQANAALHRITVVRLASHTETRDYMAARRAPNRANTKHLMRCLKRALARRLYPLILQATTDTNSHQPALTNA
jgi:transposase